MLLPFSILVLVLILVSLRSLVVGSANISILDVASILTGGNVLAEIPVGIPTALVGGPFFIVLIMGQKGKLGI
tara:strand:+ start:598 stop:816 length:219 start_codon:yes stop_codon:yes gene_type:complete